MKKLYLFYSMFFFIIAMVCWVGVFFGMAWLIPAGIIANVFQYIFVIQMKKANK